MSELDTLRRRVDRLEAIEAIRQTKYDYFHALDLKRWDQLADCFCEDIDASYGRPDWTVRGREPLVSWLRSNEGGDRYRVSHAGHNPQITLLGEDEAEGFFKLHDWVIIEPATSYRGFGHYTDRFVRQSDGKWRIQRLSLSYEYKEERLRYIGNEPPAPTPAMQK
ncbi:MAG: hypothetical protein CL908_17315 [Deltaproteobacteria bacterium]|jgi:hypothetical protein|nr:hypothetical protein [Deltaproteobacteria bacterium]